MQDSYPEHELREIPPINPRRIFNKLQGPPFTFIKTHWKQFITVYQGIVLKSQIEN